MNNANSARIFRERLQDCMDKGHYTKSSLAKKMNEAYGTGHTHNDVSRWLLTGLDTKTSLKNKNGVVSFPRLKTMLELADFFHVQVGYLIGETDMQSYDLSKACRYTGLHSSAMQALLKMTGTEKDCLDFGNESEHYRSVISKLLASKRFLDFIECLGRLDSTVHTQDSVWSELEAQIGSEQLKEAVSLYSGPTDYENDPAAPALRPEQIENIRLVNDALDRENRLYDPIIIAKYELQEAYSRLIDDLYPQDGSAR